MKTTIQDRLIKKRPEQVEQPFFLFSDVSSPPCHEVEDDGRCDRTEHDEDDPKSYPSNFAGILHLGTQKPHGPVEKHSQTDDGLTEECCDEQYDHHLAFEVPATTRSVVVEEADVKGNEDVKNQVFVPAERGHGHNKCILDHFRYLLVQVPNEKCEPDRY